MMYILDSNIVSYILKGDVEIKQKMDEAIEEGIEMVMPHIVYFEVKRWLLEVNAKSKWYIFEQMLRDVVTIEPLDEAVWDMAAILYVQTKKAGRPTGDADLLIAAFCMANNNALVTNNTKHFEHIEGLKYINWK